MQDKHSSFKYLVTKYIDFSAQPTAESLSAILVSMNPEKYAISLNSVEKLSDSDWGKCANVT